MPYIPASRGLDAKNARNNPPPPPPAPKTKKEKKAEAKAQKRNMQQPKPMPTAAPVRSQNPEVKVGQRGNSNYQSTSRPVRTATNTATAPVKTTVKTGQKGVKTVTERKVLVGFPYGRTSVGQTKWFGLGTRGVGTAVA